MEIKRGIGKVMCSPELRKSYANEILTEVFKSISKWKFDKNSKKFFWISQYQVKFQSHEADCTCMHHESSGLITPPQETVVSFKGKKTNRRHLDQVNNNS